MSEILFRTDNYFFSYRVAGILLHDDKILLQKTTNDSDSGFAVPGGHVELGETNAETLTREFKEEIGADVTVGDLKWVAEIFFPWEGITCHQICLYYDIRLNDKTQIPLGGVFVGDERIAAKNFKIEFHWMSIHNIDKIKLYPTNITDLMKQNNEAVQHFVYRQE